MLPGADVYGYTGPAKRIPGMAETHAGHLDVYGLIKGKEWWHESEWIKIEKK